MEITLEQNRLPRNILLIICKSLIDVGAEITKASKELLSKVGKDFEYSKARCANSSDAKERFAEQEADMQSLYKLFSLPPAEPIFLDVHNGVSKIEIGEKIRTKLIKSCGIT